MLMAQDREQTVKSSGETLALDLTDPSGNVSMTLPAEHTQDVIESIDDALDSQPFVARRSPTLPGNIIGIEYLDLRVFAEHSDLREEALRLEAHRGTRGFSPNTVTYIYGDDAKLSLGALETVVSNYKSWNAGEIPKPPTLR